MRGYFVRAGRSHRGSLCGFPDIEMQHFTSLRRRGLLSVPSRQKRCQLLKWKLWVASSRSFGTLRIDWYMLKVISRPGW